MNLQRLKPLLLPGLVALVALVPRLIDLAAKPFWLDEAFTFHRASLAPAALVKNSFQNHHMPSFFLMLSPLVGLGDPQFWLRLPSAVFGALSVMLVFLIARRVAGRTAGLVAALVIGLSPSALAFSQEARSYTLEMCLILISLYGIIRLAQDIPAASARIFSPAARVGWLAFILGCIGALDVLGDSLPWLLAANFIGAALLRHSPNRRQLWLNFLLADLIIALFCAPFYALLLMHQHGSFSNSVGWIPSLDLSRLWYNFGSVYFMRVADSVTYHLMSVPNPKWVVWLIDIALCAAVLASGWALRRRPAMLAVLGISFIFLPLMFTLVSIWRPIMIPRYILWSAAPFAILAGIGASLLLDSISPRLRACALGVAAVLLLTNMAPYYHIETKPRWDIAARILARDVAPGDVVYLYDHNALPILRVYLPKDKQNIVLNDSKGGLSHAMQAINQGRRVWAVYGHAGQSNEHHALAKFFNGARKLGPPDFVQLAGSRIVIVLYKPRGGVCTPALMLPTQALKGCSG